MQKMEQDPESGAQVWKLTDDPRPADNIYGEQPYSDNTGRFIAVRYYDTPQAKGGLDLVNLEDGSRRNVLTGHCPFPSFHPWSDYLYWNEPVKDDVVLRRCRYDDGKIEDVLALPRGVGAYSYGTVSPDHRWYAVSVTSPDLPAAQLYLVNLVTEEHRPLLALPTHHAKHEQFSRDGRNRVLIQLNKLPKVEEVLLQEVSVDGVATPFPADASHTPRPTGHEAWIGETARIFFSARIDPGGRGSIWTGAAGDAGPVPVLPGEQKFGHVSVSRCGRYWLTDVGDDLRSMFLGNFESGSCRRVLPSRTEPDGQQWSHTHMYLTADNRWLIFTSRRQGHPQVYGAKLDQSWVDAGR